MQTVEHGDFTSALVVVTLVVLLGSVADVTVLHDVSMVQTLE